MRIKTPWLVRARNNRVFNVRVPCRATLTLPYSESHSHTIKINGVERQLETRDGRLSVPLRSGSNTVVLPLPLSP